MLRQSETIAATTAEGLTTVAAHNNLLNQSKPAHAMLMFVNTFNSTVLPLYGSAPTGQDCRQGHAS
jgi:hypothetical protein